MTERVDNEVDYLAKAVDELGGTSLETGLADGVTGRITVVDAVGNVLYDSYEDAAEMENHASRPEIAQAMKEGRGSASRYSTTYAKRSYYAAVRLDNGRSCAWGIRSTASMGPFFRAFFHVAAAIGLTADPEFLSDRPDDKAHDGAFGGNRPGSSAGKCRL